MVTPASTPPDGAVDESVSLLPPPPGATTDTGSTSSMSRTLKWGLAAATVAGCAYVAILDPNRHTILPPCPFRSLTGFDCPGCGMTRALHSLLRGDLVGAIDHNVMLVAFLAIGVVWFAVRTIRRWGGHEPTAFAITRGWAITLGLVACAFWFGRNLPVEPFAWFDSGTS